MSKDSNQNFYQNQQYTDLPEGKADTDYHEIAPNSSETFNLKWDDNNHGHGFTDAVTIENTGEEHPLRVLASDMSGDGEIDRITAFNSGSFRDINMTELVHQEGNTHQSEYSFNDWEVDAIINPSSRNKEKFIGFTLTNHYGDDPETDEYGFDEELQINSAGVKFKEVRHRINDYRRSEGYIKEVGKFRLDPGMTVENIDHQFWIDHNVLGSELTQPVSTNF